MKSALTLAIVFVAAVMNIANAATVDGLDVTLLGVPACYKPNPLPSVTNRGTFYPRLPDVGGELHGTVNPWTQPGWPQFPDATYSAVFAQDYSKPLIVYNFPPQQPQTSMTLIVGTPDRGIGESIVFKLNGNAVATLEMTHILATFGYANGLYLSIKMPQGKVFDRATFTLDQMNAGFEWAFMNAKCPPAQQ